MIDVLAGLQRHPEVRDSVLRLIRVMHGISAMY